MKNTEIEVTEKTIPGVTDMDRSWMASFWEIFTECVIELDARFFVTNLRVKGESRFADADFVGASFLDIAAEGDKDYVRSNLYSLKAADVPYARFQFQAKSGRYYRWTLMPFEKDGSFAGCHGVAVDVTQQTLNEILLEEARKDAESANIAKSVFLSRMSHEIRTPMNAIIGMINIGLGADDVERKNYCFTRADGAAQHLLGIINDILDMSKIEADKFELLYKEFDFKKSLKNISNMALVRAEEKRQNFIVNYGDDVPSFIFSDELRLSQVITNLLTNAIKFTPEEGSVELNIKKLEDLGDEEVLLLVEVADTGIGISSEQQTKLFSPFNQADSSISQSYGGTGLGLAICKRIVELMGGVIWIESEIGEGAKFIFTLKTLKIEKEEQADSLEKSTLGGQHQAYDFNAYTILIAEDIDINREILTVLLADTNVSIEYAEDGKAAVSMFGTDPEKYDLILMDINMPVMDGYEATRQIRALDAKKAKDIPIIAMTANVFTEDIEKCLETGMNGHVGKPIDAEFLLEQLNKYLLQEGVD